jgi:sugar phosphate isomerase/epimerase/type 1 glutamine amidotransferase
MAAAVVPSEPPPRADKIRVLLVTGGHDFDHAEFIKMFDSQPDIQWIEAKHPDAVQWFAPGMADKWDVSVWYDFMQPGPTEEVKQNLEKLFEQGKPFLIMHHAIIPYKDWPEFEEIVGSTFLFKSDGERPASTFKHDETIDVQIVDPRHPITRFMDDFTIHDETYGQVPIASDVTPLLKTDHPESMPLLGWTTKYKNSPIVYLQGGHDAKAFRNENLRRLVGQSIRWLDGGLPDPDATGFVPLFNGKNFDGFTIMGDPKGFWVSEEGVIRSESDLGGFWMRTNRKYRDFIFRAEYRTGNGGNSGLFVRSAAHGYPWVTGTEIQISNEWRNDWHCTGAPYDLVPVNPRPNEASHVWHEFEVHCRGPHMKVFFDNLPIIDVDSREVPLLAGRPYEGYVGVQDSHHRDSFVEFRNLAIKELPMTTGADAWRLGIQAWTFHKYTLYEAIDKARELDLKLIELFPGQALSPEEPEVRFSHHSTPELREKVRQKLHQARLAPICYGVIGAGDATPEGLEKIGQFAQEMGIQVVTIEPEPKKEIFQAMDKVAQKYEIQFAVHNHPEPSTYWNPDKVLEMVEGCSPRIGACADTGHWVRSGLNPLECLKKLEGRIISLHFKDLNEAKREAHDTVWGTGVGDAPAMLAELDRQGFSGVFSIEYEHNWESSMPEIAQCIEFFKRQTARLSQQ